VTVVAIMQRIAVPMIGGMISSTMLMLMLIVIPAIHGLVKEVSPMFAALVAANMPDCRAGPFPSALAFAKQARQVIAPPRRDRLR
jgi:hypothetical protein